MTMNKATEIVDTWMKTQKEFMDGWMKSQKSAVEQWAEATKKMQDSLANLAGANVPAPMKELQALSASWLATMANSAKSFADESAKMQETWRGTVEKQMEMTREMVTKLSDLFKQAGDKKK
jgi:hypothetical protein